MNKKEIKSLVLASFKNNRIDPEKVTKIVSVIKKRKIIKSYLSELKKEVRKRSVFVSVPFELDKEELVRLSDKFPGKRVVSEINPELILGAKITRDDLIYEFDLKNTLENLNLHIKESYD